MEITEPELIHLVRAAYSQGVFDTSIGLQEAFDKSEVKKDMEYLIKIMKIRKGA